MCAPKIVHIFRQNFFAEFKPIKIRCSPGKIPHTLKKHRFEKIPKAVLFLKISRAFPFRHAARFSNKPLIFKLDFPFYRMRKNNAGFHRP